MYVITIRQDSGAREDFWPVHTWIADLTPLEADTLSNLLSGEFFVDICEAEILTSNVVDQVRGRLERYAEDDDED